MLARSRFAPLAPLLVALLALAAPAAAAPKSPFLAMAGTWSGAGTVTTASGVAERLRCRAVYQPAADGAALRLSLRCASESYRFDLVGTVEQRGDALSGAWQETTRNASGTVSGRISGERIEALARGGDFAARLSLVTRGDRQSVGIRSEGAEPTAARIELSRR
jgi:hypothetical protein